MKIALVGYGKMGHMIEAIALKRGNQIVATIDSYASDATCKTKTVDELVQAVKNSGAEVVIEFTHPDVVLENIQALLPLGIPLVIGTTGWNAQIEKVKEWVKETNGSLFYAANYSIGVNLFYKIVYEAAALLNDFDEYDTALWEAHHNQKADSPSGTALEIARQVMKAQPKKTELVTDAFHSKPEPQQLHVSSTRVGSVPGTHTVYFDSLADTIELTHTARSREGFALGAVRAAEWITLGLKEGTLEKGLTFTMTDLLH